MNILLINHYAGSNIHGMEYRPYYLAREWIKLGHKVLIVAASYSHLRQKNIENVNNYKEEEIEGIRYIWLETSTYEGNGLGRIKNMSEFIFRLYKNIEIFIDFQPDTVIASSTYPLDIYPARKIANNTKAKLIFELHDLWPLSPMELGNMSKYHPFIIIMQSAEDYWCKHADKVVSLLAKADEHLITRGMKKEKFVVIPNGIVISEKSLDITLPMEYQDLFKELKREGRKLIGYAGAHGIANSLDTVIKAANILQEEKVTWILIGQGPEKNKLIEKAKKCKLDNIVFLSSITKNLIPIFLERLDILYIGLQKQNLFKFGISPNKLMDYMLAGKPIIQAIEAGNDMVTEAKCGISVEAENSQAVVEAVKHLLSLDERKLQELGTNGKKYVVNNHDYSILAKKFIEAIE